MTKSNLSRRDFLKLAAAAPLITGGLSRAFDQLRSNEQDLSSPNFLIILFDAFSAKNASLYGYVRPTTPNIERFADRGIVYHNYLTAGNFTTPSTASLLTGTYPWTHRAIHLHGTVEKSTIPFNLFRQFSNKGYTRLGISQNLLVTALLYQFKDDLEILKWPRELSLEDAEFSDWLFPRDYNTAFFGEKTMLPLDTDTSGSLFLSILLSWTRGDEKRRLEEKLKAEYPNGISTQYGHSYLLETATDWMIESIPSLPKPFLAYIHLLPPHEPYLPRKKFMDIFDDDWKPLRKPKTHFTQGNTQQYLNQNRRDYDAFISNVDAEFGRFMDNIEAKGLLENTYVILTSDHGELFERGIRGHVTEALYQPVMQVPLIISKPGQKQREDIYENTSCVDMLPTLLHLADIPIPDWCEGQVLPPFVELGNPLERSLFTLEAKQNSKLAPFKMASFAITRGKYKMMHYIGFGEDVPDYEMFNLEDDPEELDDRFSTDKGIAQELQDILQEKIKEANQRY